MVGYVNATFSNRTYFSNIHEEINHLINNKPDQGINTTAELTQQNLKKNCLEKKMDDLIRCGKKIA